MSEKNVEGTAQPCWIVGRCCWTRVQERLEAVGCKARRAGVVEGQGEDRTRLWEGKEKQCQLRIFIAVAAQLGRLVFCHRAEEDGIHDRVSALQSHRDSKKVDEVRIRNSKPHRKIKEKREKK